MTRHHRQALGVAFAATLFVGPIAGSASAQDAGVRTMWFADNYATAYYTLDQRNHQVVTSIETGPKGGHPTIVRRVLENDGVEWISIDGGDAQKKTRVTLVVTRQGDTLRANVLTETKTDRARQASN